MTEYMDMLKRGLITESSRPMTAEERYIYKLKYDPGLKWWRYSEWKLARAKYEKEYYEKQYRLEVFKKLNADGRWEEGRWQME